MVIAEGSTRKIFVGGLPQSCTEEVLSNYFMQYGSIVDSVVMKDKDTGNSRGFGFITYDTEAAVEMVMSQYADHRISNKWVEVKRAVAREDMPPGGGGGGGGGGGRPGGRGPPRDGGGGGGRRAPSPRRMASGGDGRPGDWTCPRCRANVFASKDECYKCGTRKSAGGGGPPMGAMPPGAYGAYPPPCGYAPPFGFGMPPPGPYGPPPCGGCGGYPYDQPGYNPGYPPLGGPPPGGCYGAYGAYGAFRPGPSSAPPAGYTPY